MINLHFGRPVGLRAIRGEVRRLQRVPSPCGEQIAAAASVPGLKGLELISPLHVSLDNVAGSQGLARGSPTLEAVVRQSVCVDGAAVAAGALTSPDPQVRRQAVDRAKQAIEIGHVLGCRKMDLWPGEDGFDYLFQADYRDLWEWEAE